MRTRTARVLVPLSPGIDDDFMRAVARVKLEDLAARDGYRLVGEIRRDADRDLAGRPCACYLADAEPIEAIGQDAPVAPLIPGRITRVAIYPAGSEPLGVDPHGDLVAANEDGAGTGVDITAAIVPGSIRFTSS